MKIHVTGNSGSGKTTLARGLAEALELPFFSLDSVVWQPGWIKTPTEKRKLLERSLLNHDAWVIDGVSQTVRDEADLVIFMDLPRLRCWWRGFNRSLRSLFRSRPELPENCPEWKIMFRQIRIIKNFPANAGLAIRQESKTSPSRYLVFRESVGVQQALDSLVPPNKLLQRTDPVFTPFAVGKSRAHVSGR